MQRDDIFALRISRLRRLLFRYGIESIVFFNMSNIRYLSGFTGSDGALLVDEGSVLLLVDGRYITQAKQEASIKEVLEYKDKIKAIAQAIKEKRQKKIGFESAAVSVFLYNQMMRELSSEKLIPLDEELKLLRVRKDDLEIALIKKAASIGSAAIKFLIPEIKPGRTEKDLAISLEFIGRRLGADQVAFEAIVASGENSALPHARPTDRQIRPGDIIVIDFGVKYKGYCSDETCTFALGELTEEQKNAYQKVKNAQAQAIDALRAGVLAADIDRLVRNALGPHYEKFFSHGTGHGLGLDIHEQPRLAFESQDVLDTKMVVTIEPGIYLPGQWGIRIEDTILIEENSCEKLTKMDKELIIIE